MTVNAIRHCEERSDAAIQRAASRLLRFARNDESGRGSGVKPKLSLVVTLEMVKPDDAAVTLVGEEHGVAAVLLRDGLRG